MMRPMTLSELQAPLEGRLAGGDARFSRVSTDSRNIVADSLFVALEGETFDGHHFLARAAAQGAVAAIVNRDVDTELPRLQVGDTQRALGLLGAYNRARYRGPLVAITGSSGKTTAKNMVSAVLSQRGRTLSTEGNFNNEIGVPLTLLRLERDCEFAVVEMGAAAVGDIAWLCELGRPTVSLLLNAMPAHLQGFGSVEQVALAKGEIFDGLGEGDVAVINADQPWARDWRVRAGAARVIEYGLGEDAAVGLAGIDYQGIDGSRFRVRTPSGQLDIHIELPGQHNISNALAAVAVGLACGLSGREISSGLASAQALAGRLSGARTPGGALVIDDCYNANPGSVRAAIDVLVAASGRRTLIQGAMLELGETSEQHHREIGRYAREAGIEQFWGVGEELRPAVEAFGSGGRWFADCGEVLDCLEGSFAREDTVLIKGSRGARMERVLAGLTAPESAAGN